jgi:hypothetical protein
MAFASLSAAFVAATKLACLQCAPHAGAQYT